MSASGTVMQRALSRRAIALVESLSSRNDFGTVTYDLVTATDAEIPEYIRTAAKVALDNGATHYTPRPGVRELRTAIIDRANAAGFPATHENFVVTNGASEALYIVAQNLFPAGSTVLIAGPVTAASLEMIRFIGATPVFGDSAIANDFFGSAQAIDQSEAGAVLISSPSPVTGLELSGAELCDRIAAGLASGKQVVLDRSLETARLDPRDEPFPEPALAGQIVTIGSFSTGYGLRGWRVGWLTAPTATLAGLASLKQALTICTAAVSQFAAVAALEHGDPFLAERRADYATRLSEVTGILDAAGITYLVPAAYGSMLIAIGDPAKLDQLKQAGIRVESGASFSPALSSYVRIDLGVDRLTLIAGIIRLASIVGEQA